MQVRSNQNEVVVMRQLFDAGSYVSVTTTVNENPVVGEVAWFDIYNIALRVDDEVIVFPKLHIESWSYVNDAKPS